MTPQELVRDQTMSPQHAPQMFVVVSESDALMHCLMKEERVDLVQE